MIVTLFEIFPNFPNKDDLQKRKTGSYCDIIETRLSMYSCKSVLLNRNRNPFKKREVLEEKILNATHNK